VAYSSPEFKDGLVQPVREGFIHFASTSPLPQLPTQHLTAAGAAAIAFMNGFKPDLHSYCLQILCYINKFGQFGSFARPTDEEGHSRSATQSFNTDIIKSRYLDSILNKLNPIATSAKPILL
jgi:hypothetical protein